MKLDRCLLAVGVLTALIPTTLLFFALTYLFIFTFFAGVAAVVLSMWPAKKIRRIIGISLCAASTLGSFGLLAYASSSGSPVKLIVPNDFVGEIKILEDVKLGKPPLKEDGYWVYRINDDGTLITTSSKPFRRWHQERVEFRDGRIIFDFGKNYFGNHGYKVTGDGLSLSGNDPRPTDHWTIQKTGLTQAAQPTH